jgi:hypothetical protein
MNMGGRTIGGTLGLVATAFLAPQLFGVIGLTAQNRSSWTPTIAPIASPAGPTAGEPQLTVSNRGVLLSWVEHAGSKTTLRFAERTPTGWTQARTVASGEDWSINAIDVPSVLRLSDGTIVAQWLEQSGSSMHANDVRLSYSKDDGRSWARPFSPHQQGSPRERLFAWPFEMPGSALGLVWLDGVPMQSTTGDAQGTAPRPGHGADHDHRQHAARGHQAHEGHGATTSMGEMTLRFANFDAAWKKTADIQIDPRVCECCSTAAVVTSEGVLAAYRNRSDDEIRDIYVSRLVQGRWSEPIVVHADNWKILACPINGPTLSASGRDVAIAWYTVKQDQGHAYLAFSSDAGRTVSEPIRLDDSASLGRVDVELLPDGSAVATWIEFGDERSQFRTRRVTRDGARSPAVTIAGLAGGRAGGAPRMVRHGDELVFGWTEPSGGMPQVRTAIARLPAGVTKQSGE